MRIAVIGNGIIGVCTAAWLQRDGHDITFIDPVEPGEACSFGNACQLSPSHCMPIGMPSLWRNVPSWLRDPLGPLSIRWPYAPVVAPWLLRMVMSSSPERVKRIAHDTYRLIEPLFECYDPLLERAQAGALVVHRGTLTVYSTRKAAERYEPVNDLKRSFGIRIDDIGAEEIDVLEPSLNGAFSWGHVSPDNGYTLNPSELVKTLYVQCVKDGAKRIRCKAMGFDGGSSAVRSVRLDVGDPVAVDGVVVAAGAWSKRLAALLGDRVPLESQRGYHVTIADFGIQLSQSIAVPERSIVFAPMALGLRVAGTVEFGGLHAEPSFDRADALLRLTRQTFPQAQTSQVTRWMGHRPCLPDSMPVLGRSSTYSNAWLAFGHGHIGMTAGASTGREIANLVAGRATQVNLEPFSPRRFH